MTENVLGSNESHSKPKSLSLDDNSSSLNAFCISSYGAFQAVSMLSPGGIREVFCDTPPQELYELADALDESIQDLHPEEHEGEVKDLCFKREILKHIAQENEENKLTVRNSEGRYE